MAITTSMATSFKQELMVGTHNFTNTTGDTFKIALYTSSATLSAATTAYSAINEASGTNYTAGGATLVNATPTTSGTTAYADFTDAAWATSTVTARGCGIYNSTDSNKWVSAHDFGGDVSTTAGTFTIVFPAADASNAILRIA
jgi:hypothetical protein